MNATGTGRSFVGQSDHGGSNSLREMRSRRARQPVVAVVALSAGLLVACSSGLDGSTTPGPVTSAVEGESTTRPAPAEPVAADPCLGAGTGCDPVAVVDVDGDGRPDRVALDLTDATAIVRVSTANGQHTAVLDSSHAAVGWDASDIFVGAYHLTRNSGADLVFDTHSGRGGGELFAVLGWRDGLVGVPAPAVVDYPGARQSDRWAVPTEYGQIVVTCGEPGTISIAQYHRTPGTDDAGTETTEYRLAAGGWIAGSQVRRDGGEMVKGASLGENTFRCSPVHDQPAGPEPSSVPTDSDAPILGQVWASNQFGYGEVRPGRFFNGGSGSGLVQDVQWSSWGESQAIGTGTGWTGGASGRQYRAEIVAFDLGSCNGVLAYRSLSWYSLEDGQRFDPAVAQDICPEP